MNQQAEQGPPLVVIRQMVRDEYSVDGADGVSYDRHMAAEKAQDRTTVEDEHWQQEEFL